MIIIIPHGTFQRTENVGRVADRCQQCAKIRSFVLSDYYRVSWIFLPIGKGYYVESGIECETCRWEDRCDRSDFETVIPFDEDLGLDELLEETNPRLAKRQRKIAKFDDADKSETAIQPDSDRPNPAIDLQGQELVKRLEACINSSDEYRELRKALKDWPSLSEERRQKLVKKVDRFAEMNRTERFVFDIAEAFPTRIGMWSWITSFLTFVFFGVAFVLYLAVFHFADAPRDKEANIFVWSVISLGTSIGGASIFSLLFTRWRIRRWFKEVLIPQAEEMEIDFHKLMEVLNHSRILWRNEKSKTAKLQRARGVLHQVLRGLGLAA